MIRIGTAGWQYKDWSGIVYPAKPRPRGFDELAFIAEYFDTVEINTSFYGPPRPSASKKWLESIANNPNFRFTAKLFRSFTHDRNPAPNDERDFKDGIAPIAEADRLGALLLQFPWSFKNTAENFGARQDWGISGEHRSREPRLSPWAAQTILGISTRY